MAFGAGSDAFSILCRIVRGETLTATQVERCTLNFQYPLSDREG